MEQAREATAAEITVQAGNPPRRGGARRRVARSTARRAITAGGAMVAASLGLAPGPALATATATATATESASGVPAIERSMAVPEQPPDLATLQPGVRFRVWDVDRPLDRIHEPAPGEPPNFDVRREVIDYPARGDFGGFGDRFIVEVTGWLLVEEPGVHLFRLTSDDGSLLTIGGERVVWNRGLHAARPMDGTMDLDPGLHRLRILMFEHEGSEFLSLAWQPPSAPEMRIVPAANLRTEREVERTVEPGSKELEARVAGLRAGDGLELESPHPGWRLEPLRPEGWTPTVGGLARLPDGRLLVATWEPGWQDPADEDGPGPDGRLWVVANPGAVDPADLEIAVLAEDFVDPLGLTVVDGDILVAERTRITRLRDRDDDGDFETRETLASGWPADDPDHRTLDLEARDGVLFAGLSTGSGTAGEDVLAGTVRGGNGPNPPHRGTLLRVDLASGGVSYVAGGFREPRAILPLPDREEVLVGDRAGAWTPAHRIDAVRPGRFYGHYNETRVRTDRYPSGGSASLFSDLPISPPAVWLPPSEISGGPSDFLRLEEGPFAGQVLVADVAGGGLRRVWLEEVDGELQGGVTRHSQGFEGGTHRLLSLADGSIAVGMAGDREGWSWRGTTGGLQRLVPTGETAFEYERVEATPNGLRVRFTAPVPLESLRSRGGWTVTQWRYVGSPDAGGPKLDEETLMVAEARPAEDRRSVELVIPGLKEGRCVHVRRTLVDDAGRRLRATEFWYTLNRIPGRDRTAPAAADDDRLHLLVFTKTAGFRHASIPAGVAAFRELGAEHGFTLEHTEDARIFNDADLARFDVIVFLNTTGDILDLAQEAAFTRRMRAGAGFVGVHSASDTEYDWSWYGGLVGAYFRSHPAIQEATIEVLDREHPSTRHLGETWVRVDEWYCFRAAPAPRVRRLLNLDEATYEGGRMGADHPIAWCHEYDGARAFYTAGGHTIESYSEPDFRLHLLGGVLWAAGPEHLDKLPAASADTVPMMPIFPAPDGG